MKKILLLAAVLTAISANIFGATVTVTNPNDSGAGSLRDAIASAASGDTIGFDLPLPAVVALYERGALDR